MADRIIKGDSGNDVIIQNNDASRKIEVTNTGDVEVTGDIKTTTVKATNLKANDGTAGLVVADSTGEVTSSGGLKATNIKTTNLKANDGTAGISIADSTGRLTVTETNPFVTLGTNTTFPAGHVITTSTIAWDKSVASNVDCASASFAETGIEVSITPKLAAGSSKIIIIFHTGAASQTEVGTASQYTVARATSSSTTYSSATDLSDSASTTDFYQGGVTGNRVPLSFCFIDESGYSAGTTYYYQLYGKASVSNPARIVLAGSNYSMFAQEIKQ